MLLCFPREREIGHQVVAGVVLWNLADQSRGIAVGAGAHRAEGSGGPISTLTQKPVHNWAT